MLVIPDFELALLVSWAYKSVFLAESDTWDRGFMVGEYSDISVDILTIKKERKYLNISEYNVSHWAICKDFFILRETEMRSLPSYSVRSYRELPT